MEITENDVIDAADGESIPEKKIEPKPISGTINVPQGGASISVSKPPKSIVGEKGEWQITAPGKPEGDATEWLGLIKTSCHMLLDLCSNEEDVMHIFKKNKVLFDLVKTTDAIFFKEMMGKFTETKNKFNKE